MGSAVFAVSFATLIFSGPGAPEGALVEGIGVVLFSSAVSALVVSSLSSMPVIAEVQDGPSALFGLMAATIFSGALPEELKLPTLETALAVTSITSGLVSFLVGRFELGTSVRFLPQPVVGGFLAGTGYVLACGGWKVLTDEPVSLTGLEDALSRPVELYATLLPGLGFGALLATATKSSSKFYVIPACIAGTTAAYFLAAYAMGYQPSDAMEAGWLLGPFPGMEGGAFPYKPLLADPLRLIRVDYSYVAEQAPRVATIACLSVLGVLLNVSAIEVALERDSVIKTELQAAGLASILSGLGGGVVNFHSLSSTSLAKGMGASSRLEGLTVGVCYLTALLVGMPWLAYAPRALVGGLLLFLALAFLYDWVLAGATRLPRDEYAIVMTIFFSIAAFGYLVGVGFGLLTAAAIFVADYSKVPIVRASFSLTDEEGVRSSASYTVAELEAIVARGEQAYVVVLQGFIFFGTAYNLLSDLRAKALAVSETVVADSSSEDEGEESLAAPLRYVILDFSYVVGVDGSALSVFSKIRQFAASNGITLVISGDDREEARTDLQELIGVATRGWEVSPGLAERARQVQVEPGDTLASLEASPTERQQGARDVAVRVGSFDDALRWVERAILAEEAELGLEWSSRSSDSASTLANGGGQKRASVGIETFDDVVRLVARGRGRSGANGQAPGVDERTAKRNEMLFRKAWWPVDFAEGELVCRRGDVADRLFFIESGSWTATIRGGLVLPIERTFVGAVGFYRSAYSGAVRFADVRVAEEGSAWVMDTDSVEWIELEQPELAAAFHRVMASHLADTLVSRNRLVSQYYRRSLPPVEGETSEQSDEDDASQTEEERPSSSG